MVAEILLGSFASAISEQPRSDLSGTSNKVGIQEPQNSKCFSHHPVFSTFCIILHFSSLTQSWLILQGSQVSLGKMLNLFLLSSWNKLSITSCHAVSSP